MGLIRRLSHLFKAKSEVEDNPEHILNAYIEAGSEALRELSVSAKRAQSESLTLQEKMNLLRAEIQVKRGKAEEAAKEANLDMARRWLEEIHEQNVIYEQLQQDANQKRLFADELMQKLDALSNKVQTAKDLIEQYRMRNRHAAAILAAGKATSSDIRSSNALNQLQEETFLAEAKAELQRTRPY